VQTHKAPQSVLREMRPEQKCRIQAPAPSLPQQPRRLLLKKIYDQ